MQILRGIKSYYESFHRLRVPDELLRTIVVLSERYISDRFLPDKAIDLLDEACTCAALRNKALTEYTALQGQITGLKKEEEDLESSAATAGKRCV